MTKFVQTTRGWINVATIAKAVWEKPYERYQLYTESGDHLGSCSDISFNPRDYGNLGLVPATGIAATCIGAANEGDRPTADDIYVSQIPVVAWIVLDKGYAEPVALENLDGWSLVVFECPDGQYLNPEMGSYPSLAEAKQAALAKAQSEWDERNKDAA